MTFDPKAHLIQLPRRVKDQATGQWVTRLDEYLEVKWRLVWFRERYPHGSIMTESILLDWDKGIAIAKATVGDGEGGVATGTGTETRKSFEDFVEKAETRSIGRALAALGIGTQFVGEELSEGEHIADAPVAPPPGPLAANGHAAAPEPPAVEKVSAEAIDRLFQVALKGVGEPKEAFASRIRTLMRLPGSQLISKAYLQRSMTVEQYGAAMAYYELALRERVEADVPDHELPPTDAAPPSRGDQEEAQEPPGDAITPTPDPEAAAKAALRAEVATWALQVDEKEVEYVLSHYPAEKARALLWGARRQKPEPTPIEASAAD